eukprot:1605110-Prymnesium_polylepis.1
MVVFGAGDGGGGARVGLLGEEAGRVGDECVPHQRAATHTQDKTGSFFNFIHPTRTSPLSTTNAGRLQCVTARR